MNRGNDPDAEPKADALHPFDWTNAGHILVQACESLDWQTDNPEAFAKRVQSIEYGLSAETEFAAILSWLGRCLLVHKLDQDGFSSRGNDSLQVPDLLVIFEHKGRRIPVLIEVKSRKHTHLKLKTAYLDGLRRYAKELHLPLLVAWKPRRLGFWLLVDPLQAEVRGEESILTLDTSAKNDLMSTVAGDFIVVPKANAGMFFEAKIIEMTAPGENERQGVAQIVNAGFQNAYGQRATDIPAAIIAMMFSVMEEVNDVTDTTLRKSFLTREQMVYAQQILRTAVAFQSKGASPIKWRHVAKDLSTYLSRDELNDAVGKNIGPYVKFQGFLHPKDWPEFLPASWNALDDLSVGR